MSKKIIAAFATASCTLFFISIACAQDITPRFSALLARLSATGNKCAHVKKVIDNTYLIPVFTVRKDPRVKEESIVVRYFDEVHLLTMTFKTVTDRFKDGCREATMTINVETGKVASALFAQCPHEVNDDVLVDFYGIENDVPHGERYRNAWQKLLDDKLLPEFEHILASCKRSRS